MKRLWKEKKNARDVCVRVGDFGSCNEYRTGYECEQYFVQANGMMDGSEKKMIWNVYERVENNV